MTAAKAQPREAVSLEALVCGIPHEPLEWRKAWARPETSPRWAFRTTLMCLACHDDHLAVYEWLFEVSAAGNITKTNIFCEVN